MSVNKVNSDGSLLRVAGGTLYADAPIGTISPFGGSVVPSGYLICNGQAVSRTTYAELFAVIGDAFGTASDNTKFVLPDLRETVPVGSGTRGSGVVDHDLYGLGQFKDDQLQSHTHGLNIQASSSIRSSSASSSVETGGSILSNVGYARNNIGSQWDLPFSLTVNGTSKTPSGRNGTTTHGKQLGVNYIIKAKQVAVPVDFMDAINDVLKVSEPVSATNTEYTTNGSIIWKRSGNVVEVTFLNVAFASQTSGDVTLATGLPPSNNYSWSVIKSLTDTSVQQGVAVDTNGNLTSIGGSTGGSSYYDSFTYLAAD